MAQGVAGAPCDLKQARDELTQACLEVKSQCKASGVAKKACEVMMQKCGRVDSLLEEFLSRTSDFGKLADMVERYSIPEKRQAQALKGDSNCLAARRKPSLKPPPTFTARCMALHGAMHAIVQVDLDCEFEWPEFCRELDKEGMSRDRWSQPLHSQLAEALRMEGFSTHDWETSLLDKNGKVTYSPQIDIDKAAMFQRISNLTEAQMNLDERTKKYFRKQTNRLLGV